MADGNMMQTISIDSMKKTFLDEQRIFLEELEENGETLEDAELPKHLTDFKSYQEIKKEEFLKKEGAEKEKELKGLKAKKAKAEKRKASKEAKAPKEEPKEEKEEDPAKKIEEMKKISDDDIKEAKSKK